VQELLTHFRCKIQNPAGQRGKIGSVDFFSLFQIVDYMADVGERLFLRYYRQALEFVIDTVIKKFTDSQADSKAE
jgi:hypothetical protein